MARLKKSQSFYDKAVVRLAAISSIDKKLDVGNQMSVDNYSAKVEDMRQKLDDYNATLSSVDEKLNLVKQSERELRDFSERILSGIGAKYGRNSNEYVMAGGVKKSTRRKRRNRNDERKV